MNLNEVEKHVKFDLIFQLLIYIAIGLCLLLSLIVILATPAKAETISLDLTSYGVRSGQQCSTHPNNAFCAGQIIQGTSTNACGQGDGRCTMYMAYGTDNLVMSLNFGLNTSVHADSKVTITLKGTYFATGDYQCSTNVGTANNLGCRAIRTSPTSMNINFTSNSNPLSYPEFDVYQQTGNGFNPNHFFNITSIKLYETPIESGSGGSSGGSSGSTFDDSGIINNANQNTSDIIQNADSNAHDTQNVIINSSQKIFDSLNNTCKNMFNRNAYPNNGNQLSINNENGLSVSGYGVSSNTDLYQFCPTCEVGKTYYLNADFTSSNNFIYLNGSTWVNGTARTLTFADLNSPVLFYGEYGSDVWYSIGNITIWPTNIKSTCAYGSTTSKIDEIGGILGGLTDKQEDTNDKLDDLNDTSQQTYDYLTDDTDPEVDSEGIEDVLGEVEINDPLNYLLTLPLNLLRKLNQVLSTNTCSRVSFGQLYGTELYLPCIDFSEILGSNIWNTVDLIVGVGLLAIILKRFYDSISNVLTLGKEKEVRDKLDLPTPMQFLASILGGGSD